MVNDPAPMTDAEKSKLLDQAASAEKNAQDYARRARETQDMIEQHPTAPQRDRWIRGWKADMKKSKDEAERSRRLTIMALQGYRRWSEVPMQSRGAPGKGDA